MKPITIAIAAALIAGCTVRSDERGFLVATKLIEATAPAGSTACVYDAATNENVFGFFDPAVGYDHALVVENRLPSNAATGPGRLNTNDFQVEGATITTEVLVGPVQSVATQTVPANGRIPVGQAAAVGIALAQPGAILGASSAGPSSTRPPAARWRSASIASTARRRSARSRTARR